MCTYSQLKKILKKICATPQGVNGALLSQNCSRLAEKISQNVLKDSGSMKLATQLDYIYIYVVALAGIFV